MSEAKVTGGEATGHIVSTVTEQREMKAGAQLTLFHSVNDYRPRTDIDQSSGPSQLNLPSLETPSHACPETCLLGNLRSCQADNQYWPSLFSMGL